MKPLTHPPLGRTAVTLSAAIIGVLCSTGVAAAATAAPARPGGGNGFSVTLATTSSYPYVGNPVTLTATTNADVGPTPYFITVYNETTGAELAVCGYGTSCSATVAQSAPGTQDFEAFVGDAVAGNGHPGFVLTVSSTVPVTWWRFIWRGPRARP